MLHVFLLAGFLGMALPVWAQDEGLGTLDPAAQERFNSKMLGAWEGTPLPVVEKMLEMANLRPNERVYDLGSGDARILIMAAQKYGARGVGIELDPRWCRVSRAKIEKLELDNQIQIIEGDVFGQDLSAADVVTIYLHPAYLPKIAQYLQKYLHHGMRILVVRWDIPGWKPTETATVTAEQKEFRITLYTISRPGDWASFSKFGENK